MQEKVSAQYKNEIEMAKAQRDFELKKAAYDIEVNTKKAESEMAYQLQVLLTSNTDKSGSNLCTVPFLSKPTATINGSSVWFCVWFVPYSHQVLITLCYPIGG